MTLISTPKVLVINIKLGVVFLVSSEVTVQLTVYVGSFAAFAEVVDF